MMKQQLWYKQEAREWVEALPLGNGRIGAMLYSGAAREVFAMNEDTLWSGTPTDHNVAGSWKHFKKAQALALEYRYTEAEQILQENFCGEFGEAYMPLGSIVVEHIGMKETDSYVRSLSLADAVHDVHFEMDGIQFDRSSFISQPRQAMYTKYTASVPGKLSFDVSMSSPLKFAASERENCLILDVLCPSHAEPSYENSSDPIRYLPGKQEGIRARALLSVRQIGGTCCAEQGKLCVRDADEAELIFVVRSNFAGWDIAPCDSTVPYCAWVEEDLQKAAMLSFETAKQEHIQEYQRYFNRVTLDLLPEPELDLIPTDERLIRFAQTQKDVGLIQLLFDYGRYLMICGSRPGTQPLNLQGIWNDSVIPPWSSNYTTNINTEMNYWPALLCNLPEMQMPLIDMVKDLRTAGRRTAREYYAAQGFTAHHNIDLWRHTNPVGRRKKGCCTYGFWPLSVGWLCRHVFEQYEYTGDMEYLRDTAYPILKDACTFYLDVLCTDECGHRIFAPSTSPENNFLIDDQPVSLAKTTTMTVSILRELFEHAVRCSELLQTDADFAQKLRAELDKMPPLQIGSDGRLLEWSEEYPERYPTHRHVSHLYVLYPANEISIRRTPELAEACQKSLEYRTDEGTGWSLAWKINLWARLGQGDRALALLKRQLHLVQTTDMTCRYSGGGTYFNLFDAHPPFQIDGNFGACAGIAQMLVQNDQEDLILLPALPQEWQNGQVSGLCAKNGVRVSLTWENNVLRKAMLQASQDMEQVVYYGQQRFSITLRKGESVSLDL